MAALSVLCLLSFAGSIHPAGDSLAAFRSWLAAALGLAAGAAILVRPRVLGGLGVIVAIATLGEPATAYVAAERLDPVGAVTIYQKNLRRGRADVDALAADIRAVGADVVTLQELQGDAARLLTLLGDAYPHRIVCTYDAVGDVAVASRLPVLDETCLEREAVAGLQVTTDVGPVWFVSIHLRWPWPFDQPRHLDAVVRRGLAPLDIPLVVGGDFNMVPWSHALARVEDATVTRRPGPVRPTFDVAGTIGIAIDHVLTPVGWPAAAERRPKFGSDHRGLVVRVVPGG